MTIPVPYIPTFKTFAIDDWVSFIVALLLAVLVQAEGQNFMATILGDDEFDKSTRHHFNAFSYLDILGTLNFLVAGFGWSRPIQYNPKNFSMPYAHHLLVRLGGLVANLLMAGIAGSVVWIMSKWGFNNRVFLIVLIVNLSTAIYNLLPIPPLTGSALYLLPHIISKRVLKMIWIIGGVFIILFFLFEQFGLLEGISIYLNTIIQKILNYLVNG